MNDDFFFLETGIFRFNKTFILIKIRKFRNNKKKINSIMYKKKKKKRSNGHVWLLFSYDL